MNRFNKEKTITCKEQQLLCESIFFDLLRLYGVEHSLLTYFGNYQNYDILISLDLYIRCCNRKHIHSVFISFYYFLDKEVC